MNWVFAWSFNDIIRLFLIAAVIFVVVSVIMYFYVGRLMVRLRHFLDCRKSEFFRYWEEKKK